MKTTKFITCIIFLFVSVQLVHAQQGPRFNGDKREKVEAMKIAFLTKRLDLTPQEAQSFWPVYNQLTKELEGIRKNRRSDVRDAKEELANMSDKEVEKLVDNEIVSRQSELDVVKKYHNQIKQVLPIKKVALLYRSEEDFKRFLLSEIRNKGGNRPGNN